MIRKNKCKKSNITLKGMTLIELLISVSIITLLASFAYPSFNHYVCKGHRTQAMADMIRIQLTMEQTYDNGYSWASIISGGTCSICDTDTERYSFSITSNAGYTITATPKSDKGQNRDTCGTLTIQANGASSPKECWH